MSSAAPEMPDVGTPFIILGADAVLAALPASPVQLAHACHALGYELAAPATWGDELIAERCLQQLAGYEHATAVMCSCPLVTERLTRASTTLEPFMLTFSSPPVATARYLRGAYEGQKLHITYVGACPGAADASIDARLRPAELLQAFLDKGIVLDTQPKSFEALVPLDRRRYYSLPGGTPARDHVERSSHRSLLELAGDDVVLELTQQLIEQTPALLDLSVPLGCACAGAGEHALRGKPRPALLLLEPPRARQKVLDPSLRVDVTQTLSEACALLPAAAEELVEAEVQAPADTPPVREDANISPIDLSPSDAPPVARASSDISSDHGVSEDDDDLGARVARRRSVIFRSAASAPRSTTERGETVPRASLGVLRRALTRAATRKAHRQPKRAHTFSERSVELREGLSRPSSRTPRWLAIGAADLPRPVPPPPASHRPRTLLEL
ncbi:MAG TPA: hypothetical protein VGJ12_10195 [Gemmatimonadaceae bacterium]|jgi:hypothetical protein